jgi:type II secretory ATPase GspE/PulE/Tfp pilus assembly ATPase PilB-like protein
MVELEKAVQDSDFIPILENCAELVMEGITTVDEVERTVGKG